MPLLPQSVLDKERCTTSVAGKLEELSVAGQPKAIVETVFVPAVQQKMHGRVVIDRSAGFYPQLLGELTWVSTLDLIGVELEYFLYEGVYVFGHILPIVKRTPTGVRRWSIRYESVIIP